MGMVKGAGFSVLVGIRDFIKMEEIMAGNESPLKYRNDEGKKTPTQASAICGSGIRGLLNEFN